MRFAPGSSASGYPPILSMNARVMAPSTCRAALNAFRFQLMQRSELATGVRFPHSRSV